MKRLYSLESKDRRFAFKSIALLSTQEEEKYKTSSTSEGRGEVGKVTSRYQPQEEEEEPDFDNSPPSEILPLQPPGLSVGQTPVGEATRSMGLLPSVRPQSVNRSPASIRQGGGIGLPSPLPIPHMPPRVIMAQNNVCYDKFFGTSKEDAEVYLKKV